MVSGDDWIECDWCHRRLKGNDKIITTEPINDKMYFCSKKCLLSFAYDVLDAETTTVYALMYGD